MTGFASASAGARSASETAGVAHNLASRPAAPASPALSIELRSVNNRFLDVSFRLPDEFRALEPTLRELITAAFKRGKIELRLSTRTDSETPWPQPQPDQLNRLVRLESTVRGWLPDAAGLSVHEVLQWCKGSAAGEKLDEPALD
ncbi:MAG TPA: YicC/YloC family endoribonuclease, partial [Burkholderiaceae bacterium]